MLAVFLAGLLLSFSQGAAPNAEKRPSVELAARIQADLDRAEKKELRDQPLPLASVAKDMADLADQYYAEGDFELAATTLKRMVEVAQRSLDTAKIRGKKVKNAEIELRACQRKLEATRHTLSVADQAPVAKAADDIEHIRDGFMALMFNRKKK